MPENQLNTNAEQKLSVLITGGSGLIGSHLTSRLIDAGYSVSLLSRKQVKAGRAKIFLWDPEKGIIDNEALKGVDYIIHLAGANLGEKRWTRKRKDEILRSRVDSANLLHRSVTDLKITLQGFITASAIGIYGSQTSEKIFVETDHPAEDFLGTVCRKWEEAADLFRDSGIRTVKIRTAVVLEKNDTALSKIMKPAKFGFLVRTGEGNQYMPWIHIDDLCNIYLKALKDSNMEGAYNAAAPQGVTHRQFMETLSEVMKKPLVPVAVPGIILKILLGKMSDLVLKGSRVSSEKIISSGYHFLFSDLKKALKNVIGE